MFARTRGFESHSRRSYVSGSSPLSPYRYETINFLKLKAFVGFHYRKKILLLKIISGGSAFPVDWSAFRDIINQARVG
jgi:hypothetical protein